MHIVLLAIVVIAAHGGLLYLLLQQKEIEQVHFQERQGQQEEETLDYLLSSGYRSLVNYVTELAQDPGVIAGMNSGDRNVVQARVGSLDALRAALPFSRLSFHLSSKTDWVRLDVEKSALAAGGLHPAVAETLASGNPQKGFSGDPSSIGFHVAVPVVRNGRVIGAVEGIADHRTLIQTFIEQTGADAALFVLLPKKDRSATLQKLTQLGIDTKAVEKESSTDVYALDAASNVELFEAATRENDVARWQSEDTSNRTILVDGQALACRSVPLHDYRGHNAGFILWTHGEPVTGAVPAINEEQLAPLGLSAILILGCALVTFTASRKRSALPPARTPQVPVDIEKSRRYQALFEQSTDPLIIFDESGAIDANRAALELLGFGDRRDLLGNAFVDLCPEYQADGESSVLHYHELELNLQQGMAVCSEWTLRRANGVEIVLEVGMTRFTAHHKELTLASLNDPAERSATEQQLLEQNEMIEQMARDRSDALLAAQTQIMQSDKLASLGRMATGLAHEINTPIQYISDNLHAISNGLRDLFELLSGYRELVDPLKQGAANGEAAQQLREKEEQLDLDHLVRDIPQAITEGLEGVQRIASIVSAMKDFSQADHAKPIQVDLNHLVENTTTVARSEFKYVAELEFEQGDLPVVECYPGAMRQVFLNILLNATQAIADTGERGKITVRTRCDGDWVEVAIADTGPGIPDDIHGAIFDPFFTTRPPGKGSGQGLFIARQIVCEKHNGDIRFETEPGEGTTFLIRIPLMAQHPQDRKYEAAHAAV